MYLLLHLCSHEVQQIRVLNSSTYSTNYSFPNGGTVKTKLERSQQALHVRCAHLAKVDGRVLLLT